MKGKKRIGEREKKGRHLERSLLVPLVGHCSRGEEHILICLKIIAEVIILLTLKPEHFILSPKV